MLSQILALIIAIVLFSALLQGKYPRYLLTLAAGGAMVLVVLLGTMGSPAAALEALSVDSFVKPQFWFAHGGVTEFNVGINWSTILFLAGMMIMVEAMSDAGFFDWVCLRLAKALGFRPMPLMLSFMVLAALLSMFVDSITVVLFLVVATARLAHFLRFDPVPMIIGEIFAANLGIHLRVSMRRRWARISTVPGPELLGLFAEQRRDLPDRPGAGAGVFLSLLPQ